MKGLKADAFMADRGYDTDAIVEGVGNEGMQVVIPPRAHRKVQRPYDAYLYKLRHLVENAFLTMKQWRSLATRYAKRLSSYRAIVQIRCMVMWLKVIS